VAVYLCGCTSAEQCGQSGACACACACGKCVTREPCRWTWQLEAWRWTCVPGRVVGIAASGRPCSGTTRLHGSFRDVARASTASVTAVVYARCRAVACGLDFTLIATLSVDYYDMIKTDFDVDAEHILDESGLSDVAEEHSGMMAGDSDSDDGHRAASPPAVHTALSPTSKMKLPPLVLSPGAAAASAVVDTIAQSQSFMSSAVLTHSEAFDGASGGSSPRSRGDSDGGDDDSDFTTETETESASESEAESEDEELETKVRVHAVLCRACCPPVLLGCLTRTVAAAVSVQMKNWLRGLCRVCKDGKCLGFEPSAARLFYCA
jgi:hypothetical protein